MSDYFNAPAPDPNRYLPVECFVAGALSTLPPFDTHHPAYALPFARHAIDAMGEYEPDDAMTLAPAPSPAPQDTALSGRPNGDVAAAIATVEDSRRTHIEWRDHIQRGCDDECRRISGPKGCNVETLGDAAHHQRCIDEYDNVLAVLRDAA